ncbi:MAG TPA: TetR/AcrR family transcriptional regulator [Burkholderiales bacterium]|nr:TetR/AcrR family transcriptional regulator [Burkholderiales bacterium]
MKTKRVFKVSNSGSGVDPALRSRIVQAGRELFLGRGFVRVTADDIARRLGISKATLYKLFPSKEAILRAVSQQIMTEIISHVEELLADGRLGLPEKLAALFASVARRISEFGPNLVQDIQKAAPRVWKEIDDFRREKINKNFGKILESGRREGLFRGDIDEGILLRMFTFLIGEFVNPEAILRSGRTPAQAFESVIKVFFQGILTDKGRADFLAWTPALFEPRKEGAS